MNMMGNDSAQNVMLAIVSANGHDKHLISRLQRKMK